MVGLGVLLVAVSLYLRRGDSRWIPGGAAVGVVVAFGSFLASNIQPHSDLLWFITILFVLAAALAVAAWPRRGSPTRVAEAPP